MIKSSSLRYIIVAKMSSSCKRQKIVAIDIEQFKKIRRSSLENGSKSYRFREFLLETEQLPFIYVHINSLLYIGVL